MKEKKKLTNREARACFESLCKKIEELSVEMEEYSDAEFERLRNGAYKDNEGRDFVEDIWDISRGLTALKSRMGRMLRNTKEKYFFE